MRAVNLLPREERSSRIKAPSAPLVAGALAVVVAGGAVAGLQAYFQGDVADRERDLAAIRAELEATPKPVKEDPANARLVAEKDKRISALADALSGRLAFDQLLSEIALVLPNDVWLSRLDATAPGAETDGAAAPVPSADGDAPFTLSGYTYSQEGVARLLARMSVIPYLQDVRLERSALAELAGRRIVEFSIASSLRSPKDFQ